VLLRRRIDRKPAARRRSLPGSWEASLVQLELRSSFIEKETKITKRIAHFTFRLREVREVDLGASALARGEFSVGWFRTQAQRYRGGREFSKNLFGPALVVAAGRPWR